MAHAVEMVGVGKAYRLGVIDRAMLRDDAVRAWARWRGRRRRPTGEDAETQHRQGAVWALRDITFGLDEGEVLGVIGRNGAGKSTALKLLSQVTAPTRGEIRVRGRIASLLEVGTGFHPELTGRENVFLNGAILGMTKAEIRRKFDEIVEFSEVAAYIDTPVKRYSSGMYVRLAFAVAAHLEPEILVVDEVLAVGDAGFQRRCLGKMGEVAAGGRTVLFVSHNMAAVQSLCTRALVLKGGRLDYGPGATNGAVDHYLGQLKDLVGADLADRSDRRGAGQMRLTGFRCLDGAGRDLEVLACGNTTEFVLAYECAEDFRPDGAQARVVIRAASGPTVAVLNSEANGLVVRGASPAGTLSCTLDRLPLTQGAYIVDLILSTDGVTQDWVREVAAITVETGDFYGTGMVTPPTHGGVLFDQEWRLNGVTAPRTCLAKGR
ncbi:MAG: ABC transporter ATP-binding protein [Armatimonadetes bacterium]|nr:ABC transporter ATP-binding protein [Armatimonadota bacterium]